MIELRSIYRRGTAGSAQTGVIQGRRGFSLAELIAAIALLSIFGVIAARMFFLSDGLSRKTEQFDKSVMLAANIAEAWQAAPMTGADKTNTKALAEFSPREFVSDAIEEKEWVAQLDDNLQPSLSEQGSIRLTVRQEKTDIEGVWQLVVNIEEIGNSQVSSDLTASSPVYELTASRYFSPEVTK